MPYPKFDRNKLDIKRLADRKNKVYIERDHIPVTQTPRDLTAAGMQLIDRTVARIKKARELNRSVMLTFGAHTIKNGMAPTLIALIKEGWVTHLATNGAGIIHDWEFAFQGKSSEDVRENVERGQFGIWDRFLYQPGADCGCIRRFGLR
jgi:deoxyhypusine synthase